jgi:hypothetical protein
MSTQPRKIMGISSGYTEPAPVSTAPEIFTVFSFGEKQRIYRAALVFIPVLVCAVVIMWLQNRNGALQECWWFPAMVFATGGIFSYRSWRVRWKINYTKQFQPISKSSRQFFLAVALGLVFLGSVFIISIFQKGDATPLPVGLFMAGITGIISLPFFILFFFKRIEHQLTPSAKAYRAQPELQPPPPSAPPRPIKWWERYLIGIALVAFALYLPEHSGKDAWTPILFMFMAFFFMYEFLIIGIFGLIGYLFFGAIAALPTSVAIIIGAFIIARSRGK